MTTKFNMTRDINGFNGFGLKPTDTNYITTLTAAGGLQSLTVPSDSAIYIAIISVSPGNSYFVAVNNTATLPSGSFVASSSEMNPAALEVKAGDTMSFITAETLIYLGVKFNAVS